MAASPALPLIYPITGTAPSAADWWRKFTALVGAGHPLIQLRSPPGFLGGLPDVARRARDLCRAAGARLVLNGPPALALELGLAGVHLNGARLAACSARPVPAGMLLGASCHSAAQLARALELRADYALLSPVCATPSHAGATALGWAEFESLARGAGLPVLALGGVGPEDLERARTAGARGVAGISAYWR